jgi:hypothetical protein
VGFGHVTTAFEPKLSEYVELGMVSRNKSPDLGACQCSDAVVPATTAIAEVPGVAISTTVSVAWSSFEHPVAKLHVTSWNVNFVAGSEVLGITTAADELVLNQTP